MLHLLAQLHLLALPAAFAAPTVEVRDDNSVVGEVTVKSPIDAVREKVADPVWLAKTDGGGTEVTVLADEGECLKLRHVTPNAIKTVRYTTRQCPTKTGFESVLVESDNFTSYRVEWTLDAREDGSTALRYLLHFETNMMVPQFIINRQSRKGVEHLLVALEEVFGGV